MKLFEEARLISEIDGKLGEVRKAVHKWSLPERTLNAVISRINYKYSTWNKWLLWVEERRTNRWWLYVRPGTDLSTSEKQIVSLIDQIIGLY